MKKIIVILAIFTMSCQASKIQVQTSQPQTMADTLPPSTRGEIAVAKIMLVSLSVLFIGSLAIN